ncbi:hypothetical protein ACFXKG_28830 [Streptomyces sp. NPDC059255]|uniref:hypothetical protein n=1 Tax=Streptomyces sp. NPDC059255 TaxID=3346793 RepID=UPI00367BF8F1
MAETTPGPVAPLQLIESEADGYCDPVTGVCAVPGTALHEPAADQDNSDPDGNSQGAVPGD